MYYVYKRHKETNQKYTRIGIYLNKLKRYKNVKRGLQRCVPNEHLDHKENNFLTSSEDQSSSMTQIP